MSVQVLVVMGVSGTGKTTLAQNLSRTLGWPMAEGDDLHSDANRAKMAAGIPLTDADRWPWLRRIRAWIDSRLESGEPGVITCSALKRSYRDVLRAPGVVFVHLDGDRAVLADRLGRRRGHYMPPSLLDSQLATLEPLGPDEDGIVVRIGGTPEEELDQALDVLRGRLG